MLKPHQGACRTHVNTSRHNLAFLIVNLSSPSFEKTMYPLSALLLNKTSSKSSLNSIISSIS
ncbi:hypothetical protein BHO_0018900 (plasmid) [Borrelia hermsii YBT]|uniref:Uncharacterized protein n=1 Tax=Borrelia hermsii YBT TaxID=1313295 RepID=W5T0R3_BORHE|nr:hypothetical protein BHO_0018900 [Borrelia hermsii YBT]